MQSVYLDIAIGLALAFFLLSLVPGAVNEAVTWLLRVRAKYLWAFLRDLLDGPATAPGRAAPAEKRLPDSVGDVLWRFPMSRSADARPTYTPTPPTTPPTAPPTGATVAGAGTAGAGTADAVPAGPGERALTDELHGRLAGIDVPSAPRGTKHTTIKHIPPGRFAITLLDMMIETNPDNAPHAIDEWLRRHAGRPASGPLQALWRSAGGSLERFRAGIEEWFDDEMQRLSDLYRRQTRWVLAILAPVVAIGLSVDSVELGRSLWTNGDLRVSLVATASRDDRELDRIYETCRAGPSMADATEELERVRDCVSEHLGQLNALNLTEHAVFVDPGGWRDRVASGHLPGMLGTAIAIWFGAPFWYDVLRRLTGVRARGR